jgi:nicotinamidase-related amidase
MTGRRSQHSPTALLLVDFINHFRFDGADRLAPRAIRAARAAARLKASLARRGCPCIYANDNFGEWRTEFSALVKAALDAGGASGEIAGLLRPGPRDLSILKPRYSAFYGTPLEFLLDELGASTLVIAGIAVDMCVMATAQDAYMRKYKLRIPSNCVAGFVPAQERAALEALKRTMKADISPHRG